MIAESTNESTAALSKHVASLKEQARVLLDGFERGEITSKEAKARAEQLEHEIGQAERQLETLATSRAVSRNPKAAIGSEKRLTPGYL